MKKIESSPFGRFSDYFLPSARQILTFVGRDEIVRFGGISRMQPSLTSDEGIKISARMPRRLIQFLNQSFPKKSISEVLRSLIEQEMQRRQVKRAHMKLYGRFKPEHFDESLL